MKKKEITGAEIRARLQPTIGDVLRENEALREELRRLKKEIVKLLNMNIEFVESEKPIALPKGHVYELRADGKVVWPPCRAEKGDENSSMEDKN